MTSKNDAARLMLHSTNDGEFLIVANTKSRCLCQVEVIDCYRPLYLHLVTHVIEMEILEKLVHLYLWSPKVYPGSNANSY